MTWNEVRQTTARDLLEKLFSCTIEAFKQQGPHLAWRGEPQTYPAGIVSSVDRNEFLGTGATKDLLRREQVWYNYWWKQMEPLMLPRDIVSPQRDDGLPELAWLDFAAHHGCQTRLVDWSESPWVALYFACCQDLDKPGRLWRFDTQALERKLSESWGEFNVDRTPDGRHHDFVQPAFKGTDHRWVVTQYNTHAPARMVSQRGLFTVASQLGLPHDKALDELLPDDAKVRFHIDAEWKRDLLIYLRQQGIHHESLQYPMLDQVASKLKPPPLNPPCPAPP